MLIVRQLGMDTVCIIEIIYVLPYIITITAANKVSLTKNIHHHIKIVTKPPRPHF